MQNPNAESAGSGDDYAREIRAVLERASELEQAQGHSVTLRKPVLSRPPVVFALGVIFAVVVAWNVAVWRAPPAPLPPAVEEASTQVSLMVASQIVEAFRQEHGRLPATLEEAGLPPGTFSYRVEGDEYILETVDAAVDARFDSREGPVSILRSMGMTPPAEGNPTGNP
ncbi:MAG: hypothetical protein ACE5GJ_00865 [Gemmatimonadota bacterium]